MYVNRQGKRFPKIHSRLLFTASFVILPYLVTRVVRRVKSKTDSTKDWLSRILTSYPNLLDTIMNIHVALFYFQGLYYSILKRLFGMRYVFGHNKDPQKLQKTGNYTVLGGVMLVQFLVKFLVWVKQETDQRSKSEEEKHKIEKQSQSHETFYKLDQLENLQKQVSANLKLQKKVQVDLSDEIQLPYIPEASRSCMLCLSPMVDPSAANCGHMFCWECIVDWVREHPECPLCRQVCLEQNLLPLR